MPTADIIKPGMIISIISIILHGFIGLFYFFKLFSHDVLFEQKNCLFHT